MRRFPVVATIAFAVAFAILCGLGVWQLQRKAWKQHLLAQIAGVEQAPAQPVAEVLDRAKQGQDVDFTRVELDCAPPDPPQSRVSLYALRDGGVIGWRSLAPCRVEDAPWPMVVVDRGFETASDRAVRPSQQAYPPLRHVIGIVRAIGGSSAFQRVARSSEGEANGYELRPDAVAAVAQASGLKTAPVIVVAEHEDPAPSGLAPAAIPNSIAGSHIGEYAPTWFGLALGLLCVYVGMMVTRLRKPPEAPSS